MVDGIKGGGKGCVDGVRGVGKGTVGGGRGRKEKGLWRRKVWKVKGYYNGRGVDEKDDGGGGKVLLRMGGGEGKLEREGIVPCVTNTFRLCTCI